MRKMGSRLLRVEAYSAAACWYSDRMPATFFCFLESPGKQRRAASTCALRACAPARLGQHMRWRCGAGGPLRHGLCVLARRPRLGSLDDRAHRHRLVGAWPCLHLRDFVLVHLAALLLRALLCTRAVDRAARESNACACARGLTSQAPHSAAARVRGHARPPVRLYARTARTDTHAPAVHGQRHFCAGQMPLDCTMPVRVINHAQAPSTTTNVPRRKTDKVPLWMSVSRAGLLLHKPC